MFKLQNPIPESYKDETFIETSRKYSIIPYYGQDEATSHYWLKLFNDICQVSPTLTAIKEDFKRFSFGAGIDVVDKIEPGYSPGGKEVDLPSLDIRDGFVKSIKEFGLSPLDIIYISEEILSHKFDSGNSFHKIELIDNGGEWTSKMTPLHYLNCGKLLKNKEDVAGALVYATTWEENMWQKYPPKIYPITNAFSGLWNWEIKTKFGITTYTTVIHDKSKGDTSRHYGRTKLNSLVDAALTEIKYLILNNKIAGTEIVTKLLLLFENPSAIDSKKGDRKFRLMGQALREATTNDDGERESTSSSATALRYPKAGNAPKDVKIDVNRDYKYEGQAIENTTNFIYSVWGWSKVLTGFARQSAGIGDSAGLYEYVTKGVKTIEPFQEHYNNYWNWIICEMFNVIKGQEIDKGIKFNSLVDKLVKKVKDMNGKEENDDNQ